MHALHLSGWLLLSAYTLGGATVPPDIYQCYDEHGNRMYSDFACSARSSVTLTPTNRADGMRLTPAETRLLKDQLQRQRQQRAEHAEKRTKRRVRIIKSKALCRNAKAGLKEIAKQRRHGYKSRHRSKLEQRKAKLRADKHEHC